MASARNIRSPGIEVREIDRSQQSTQDNSLPNAPTILVPGFSDFGESYSIKWINSSQTLINTYGYPQTEFEQLFHNACIEILNKGGICLATKLPYDNNESRGYTFCDFIVGTSLDSISESQISDIQTLDSSLTSFVQISSANYSGKMSLQKFDDLVTRSFGGTLRNKIRVVDISKSRYIKAPFNALETDSGNSSECLGIFPVITTPVNALYWQQLKNSIDDRVSSVQVSSYNPVTILSSVEPNVSLTSIGDEAFDQLNLCVDFAEIENNLVLSTASDDKDEESVSKMACQCFPQINFMNSEHLDPTYLKQIGVVVVKAFSDDSVSKKINFKVLESFVGSLDKNSRTSTGKSQFIDTVVNENSQFINLFSNVQTDILEKCSTIFSNEQKAIMLGFYPQDCVKQIDAEKSIIKPLAQILEMVKNPNQYPLDIIIDAGVSNIAQYFKTKSETNSDDFTWKLSNVPSDIIRGSKTWNQVLKKFDDFCKYTRKDCMFIADGLRPFCLDGDQKIVRRTKIGSSVEKDILPRLRYISGLNSSYSAGYCNWFQARDYYTSDLFWCPPSIKVVGSYIYCDTYFHTWDAPAGLTRGIMSGVVDTAFSPNEDEAGKIYDQSWNYAINYPIEGIVVEGQKTFQSSASALDRVNVRRLLLGLEKKVVQAAKYFVYEGNTEYLRQRFVDTIKTIFEDAVNGNGISEYAIKCDNDLNTPEVIDNNELRCKIALKPIKTIEFIVLDFICTSQSASVNEEVAS